jgi:hypothetical protein
LARWSSRAGLLMAQRKPFLVRVDGDVLAALQAWAADDLRSVNGQVEFLLRRALREAGRLPGRDHEPPRVERPRR